MIHVQPTSKSIYLMACLLVSVFACLIVRLIACFVVACFCRCLKPKTKKTGVGKTQTAKETTRHSWCPPCGSWAIFRMRPPCKAPSNSTWPLGALPASTNGQGRSSSRKRPPANFSIPPTFRRRGVGGSQFHLSSLPHKRENGTTGVLRGGDVSARLRRSRAQALPQQCGHGALAVLGTESNAIARLVARGRGPWCGCGSFGVCPQETKGTRKGTKGFWRAVHF